MSATTVVDPLTGDTVAAIDLLGCFARGTRVATPQGERRVESLVEGDHVLVSDSGQLHPKRVRWVGHRRLDLAAHPRPERAAPIRFRAGALGNELPRRDLLLSPDHALLIDGMLIPAKLLLNGMTIVRERNAPSVTYYHIELDDHSIMLAEGVPAESYLDSGNRGFFANAGLPTVLHPDLTNPAENGLTCAPLARSIEQVEPAWRALAERARTLGWSAPATAATSNPDLHLLVDGVIIQPRVGTDGGHQFAIPPGATSLRLVSRWFLPADARPYADDWRRLGVAVSRMVFHVGAEPREIAADHPCLSRGWYAPERSGSEIWRWTDGEATLPFDCGAGGILEIRLHATGLYRLETATGERLAA